VQVACTINYDKKPCGKIREKSDKYDPKKRWPDGTGTIRMKARFVWGTPSGVPFPALILSGFSRCGGLESSPRVDYRHAVSENN